MDSLMNRITINPEQCGGRLGCRGLFICRSLSAVNPEEMYVV